ncbi:MAG: C4-type zinc ribbon domain-containing protein [Anaerolineae bacterium]
MSQVQQLYQLQQIDTEIREKKQRLGEVLRAQKETEELLAAKQRLNTAVTDLQTWQTQKQDLDRELQNLKAKARSAEQRLYSGNVKNPKELTDLQHSIDSLGRQRAVLEDEILEAMIMIEDAEAEKDAADEALRTIQADWEQAQGSLKKEQNELALRLHVLTGLRQTRLGTITAESLAEYEVISRQAKGVAVVKIKNSICTGCSLNVSAQKEKEAREGKKVYCANCGRILAV